MSYQIYDNAVIGTANRNIATGGHDGCGYHGYSSGGHDGCGYHGYNGSYTFTSGCHNKCNVTLNDYILFGIIGLFIYHWVKY